MQQSILRALWGADAEIQHEICVGYQSIMNQECDALSPLTAVDEDESKSNDEYWFVAEEEDQYAIYLKFKGSSELAVCAMEGENYYFENLEIKNQKVEWNEQQYEIEFEEDLLLFKGEDPQEFDFIETTTEICDFYFSSKAPSDLKVSELKGTWYAEFEEDEEALYFNFDQEDNAEICELKKGEVVSQSSGVFKNSAFSWEDDEPVPVALISGMLMINGEDYLDIFTKTDQAPDDCWD